MAVAPFLSIYLFSEVLARKIACTLSDIVKRLLGESDSQNVVTINAPNGRLGTRKRPPK